MKLNFFLCILGMALPTYLIRMIPFTAFRKKIKSRFAKSFFYYIPYAVLAAMTFPAVFYSTGNIWTALVGFAVALVLSLVNAPMTVVALSASAAAFLFSLLPI
ncbi:MAG: AzlD domain-containing protein [Clostridia bacterium]|nr:AzlD domain-containing protein [Clostridia bacterium]